MFHRRLCVTPSRDLPRAPCDRGAGVVARLSGRLLGCNTLNRVFLADPQQPLLHLPPTPPLPLAPISHPHPPVRCHHSPRQSKRLGTPFPVQRKASLPPNPTPPTHPVRHTPLFRLLLEASSLPAVWVPVQQPVSGSAGRDPCPLPAACIAIHSCSAIPALPRLPRLPAQVGGPSSATLQLGWPEGATTESCSVQQWTTPNKGCMNTL